MSRDSIDFLLDNVPKDIGTILEKSGYRIGKADQSQSDEDIISASIKNKSIIVTRDQDFGHLAFLKGVRPFSVILIRIKKFSRKYSQMVASRIIDIMKENPSMENKFCKITTDSMKVSEMPVDILLKKVKENEQ